jgi:hypothetical protein
MPIETIHEFYTDGITEQGSVRRINFHFLADFRSEAGALTREWHYYGTPRPAATVGGLPAVQHPEIKMPDDIDLLPVGEASDLLYEFAQRVVRGTFSAARVQGGS